MTQLGHFPAFDKTSENNLPADPLKALIMRLSQSFGPSGSEEAVRTLIRDEVRSLGEARTDGLGNLIVHKRGAGGGPRRKLMLAAHMDEVGVMVTHVDRGGFLHFSLLGPVQTLSLLGQRVHFANGLVGVIGREEKKARAEVELDRLFIDVSSTNANPVPVFVGDAGVVTGPFADMGSRLVGKALDDRVGCAILIETLRQVKKCPNDLYVVFTVQQQVGSRGAITSAFGVQPDYALAVDVAEARDTPEPAEQGVALGQGPAIKVKDWDVLASPVLRDMLVAAAKETQVPYQFEVSGMGSTGAGMMQVAHEGAHAGALTVPLRYAHTPAEMVDFADVQNAVKMLVAFLAKPLPVNGQ